MTQPFDLWGQRGWCRQEVEGESRHSQEIRSLFGEGFDPDGSEITVQVQLVPEPGDGVDSTAVRVLCSGAHIGYLPREQAAEYTPILTALVDKGWTPQVQAEVWAQEREDWDNPGQRAFVGAVRLDLAEAHMLVPTNLPPTGHHAVLPTGRFVEVTGEERHLATLAPLAGRHGESWVYVTLHESGAAPLSGLADTLVEVRVNGTAVGTLSSAVSTEILPVVTRLSGMGLTTAARAVLTSDQVRADLSVNMAKASELSDAWLESPEGAGSAGRTAPATAGAPTPSTGAAGSAETSTGATAGQETSTTGQWRFVTPPGWPQPPAGWVPPQGWQPDPAWPPAPEDWQFWAPN